MLEKYSLRHSIKIATLTSNFVWVGWDLAPGLLVSGPIPDSGWGYNTIPVPTIHPTETYSCMRMDSSFDMFKDFNSVCPGG